MASKICAVIDTNVIVSAMLTHNPESPTKVVLDKIFAGKVVPLYVNEIIEEYQEVLSRKQFPFRSENIADVINAIERFGFAAGRKEANDEAFPDSKDIVFYEVALKRRRLPRYGEYKTFPKKAYRRHSSRIFGNP